MFWPIHFYRARDEQDVLVQIENAVLKLSNLS